MKFFKKNLNFFQIFLLICCLAANSLLYIGFKSVFIKLQFSRVFPKGYLSSNKRSILKQFSDSEKSKLLFLGDSRVEMWDTKVLSTKYAVLNEAHGGMTSSQLLCQVGEELLPQSDWVVIQIGINDLHSLGGLSQYKNTIVNQLKSNIQEILRLFKSRGSKIILTTIFPPGKVPIHRSLFWDEQTMDIIDHINNYIYDLCLDESAFLIDSNGILRGQNRFLERRFADLDFFLHVNKKGYSVLNQNLIKIIMKEKKNG